MGGFKMLAIMGDGNTFRHLGSKPALFRLESNTIFYTMLPPSQHGDKLKKMHFDQCGLSKMWPRAAAFPSSPLSTPLSLTTGSAPSS